MARRVSHRYDYGASGPDSGPNVMLDWELLWSPGALAEVLFSECVVGEAKNMQITDKLPDCT